MSGDRPAKTGRIPRIAEKTAVSGVTGGPERAGYLPDAQITFDKETGGRELSGNYLIDNTRLVSEFGVQYRPYRERVLQIINDIRKEEGLPQLAPQ
jgi:hypothetical protein